MRWYWLAIGTLCVWRISHLLNAEDGPAGLLARLRRKAGGGFWGSLLDCFYCLSLWVSAPFAFLIGEGVKERCLLWLAFSAGAILLERATASEAPLPTYFEHGGKDDVLLRESENTGAAGNLASKD